ncbi:adenosylmethionine decarboxylase [Thermosulfurimonas marina]|uniref:Adenosylmethionine decarboxylase n=1 Tax=Thermosulfurimonas marina TaxID=2047767 RepID=A0A6H1WT12_9BACT|nr:adenosylmethionine decarboxylase [Thermosulfurimonas marina]QJA06311.1 adenosylmethionine decarboxylase [Thermosulfurimonas marina]
MRTTPVCQIDRLDVLPAQGGRRERAFPVSTHLLVEMWQAPFKVLARAHEVERALRYSGNGCGDRGEVIAYQFQPYGVSAKATFEEAHIFIHTWPENGYAAVDIFAASQEEAYAILERMKEAFRPAYVHVVEVKRGNLFAEGET